MDIREAARYFRTLFTLWQRVSEAYANHDDASVAEYSRSIDRLQLDNWKRVSDSADAR